jgi:ATP-dependent helicase/nuclease subunit A
MGLRGRQKEAIDPSRSVCVVAGAGTGKTHILITKYIDLLERGYNSSDILALTFTRKAASEMKERVEAALDLRVSESPSKWRNIRDEFIWADISTFHSFCSKVLHEFPIEANIGPGFIIIDELQAKRLQEEALEECLHLPSGISRESICRLLGDTDEWHVKGYLRELYKNRIFVEEFFKELDGDDEAIIERWKSQYCDFQKEILSIFQSNKELWDTISELHRLASACRKDKDGAVKYLRSIEPHLVDLMEQRSPEIALSAMIELSGIKGRTNMGSSANWKLEDLKSLRDSYAGLQSFFAANGPLLEIQVGDEIFSKYALGFLRDLRNAFREYLKIVDELKRQRGGIDFSDMIFAAYRLFRDHKDLVRAHFLNRYRYILVDEFQDTDPIQCKIIWMILGNLKERSDRLFVVGDPKQSIYLFRDADVTLFKEMQEIIQDGLKGKIVPLNINFRSAPQIVYFVNYLFSKILSSSSKPWEFGYEPLDVSHERINDSGSVEILLAPSTIDGQERSKNEAEIIARRIQNLIETEKKEVYWDECKRKLQSPRPAQYRDVAILLQRRTNLRYLERALQKYGMPYHVSSGLGFYERQEVVDLFNLLKFLDNVLDDVALYGILRSPYFGISDVQLHKIAKSGSGSLWSRAQQYSQLHESTAVSNAVRLLEDWSSRAHVEPIADLLRGIIERSGIYAVYGGLEDGSRIIANLEKFLQIARNAQMHGITSISDFSAELELLIDEAPMEGEGQIDTENANVVKIMTVHASKGLEFPIVVIPDMAGKGEKDRPPLMVDEILGIGLRVPDPSNEYKLRDTFQLQLLKISRDEKSEAERKRLFYVAATRAKDHLILCGSIIEEIASLEEGSTWLDWTYACLGINGENIKDGAVTFEWPKGSSIIISIPIIDDPEDIPAEIRERKPELVEAPEQDLSKAEMPEFLRPIQVPEQEHIFSASEIEEYKLCPKKYNNKHVIGGPEIDIIFPATRESARTQGLIIHEIFQGKDPSTVLRKYGISDSNKERLYRAYYDKFLSSDFMKNVKEDHRELPFLARIDGILFSGKIDRMTKKSDGSWNIIDYKTMELSEEQMEEKYKEYSYQLAIYRKAMQQLLGEEICVFAYFTSIGKFFQAKLDDTRVISNIKKIAQKINSREFAFETCNRCERNNIDKLDGLCPALKNEIDITH